MKRKGVLIVCLLALAAVCCACTGRVKQSGISARDPLTERTLTLNIAASYSPGDLDASGGCSFSADMDFSEMVEIAEAAEQVAFVEVFVSFEPYYPYQHAAVFTAENGGGYSAFYLADGSFYGMGARIIGNVEDADGAALLFPYHLLSDLRVSPAMGTLLDGVEYSCVASEQIREDFERFYRLTGHYELTGGEYGFVLTADWGQAVFTFTDHAGLTFVSVSLD